MILFFYNIALLAALVAGIPWWLWKMATTEKYRDGLAERLGQVPESLRARANGSTVIWLHAVSVGEVLAVSRLVSELDHALAGFTLLISTTTRTGQALARERFGAARVFYCPLDLPWAVHAYLNALRPRVLILAETEFWPNLLTGCFRRGIPVVVVNARISDRSWPRYQALKRLWAPILVKITRALAQTDLDAQRLQAIGIRHERVSVGGNLKFDVRAAQASDVVQIVKASASGLRLLVAGSTLDGEESALLAAWPRLLETDRHLAMVLAPRHPERFEVVAELLEKSHLPFIRRSAWKGKRVEEIPPLQNGEIVLLDTIGELASIYALASVALIGGSLVPAGGHNPLEPAQFGVPIIMGPHYANFRAIVDDLRAHEAIRITSSQDLASSFIDMFTDRALSAAMGERAKQVFERQAGATARTVQALQELLTREAQPA